MKCCRCPLYHYWSNESDRGEACAIFGDGWDSPFQYEDKEGTIIGCYLDRHFIEKADAERDEYYASMAETMARQLKAEADTPQEERSEEMGDTWNLGDGLENVCRSVLRKAHYASHQTEESSRTIINLDSYEITALIWAMNEYIHNGQFAERI